MGIEEECDPADYGRSQSEIVERADAGRNNRISQTADYVADPSDDARHRACERPKRRLEENSNRVTSDLIAAGAGKTRGEGASLYA